MNLDDLDRLLEFPVDINEIPGLLTGRANYSEKRETLQGHLWIDPRISGYTFKDNKEMTPILRYDFDIRDELLATITSFTQLYQILWNDIHELLDSIEKNGWEDAGISKSNK